MKRTLVIVFTVILLIHLLALLLFLNCQRTSPGPADNKKNEDSSGDISVPEPTIDTSGLPFDKQAEKKVSGRKNSSVFYNPRPIPPFDYSKAVNGTIAKIPETKKVAAGILLDLDTGRVLWCKNPTKPVPIASMTKMMTALLAFEDMRDGKISFSTPVKVSVKAAKITGSRVWLDPRETFQFRDLLKAMLIKSANDAAYLVGETLAGGDINRFIARMNKKASEIGMKHAVFFNPNGLPGTTAAKDNKASCEDIAKLAARLLCFPEAVKITSTKTARIPRKIGKYKYTVLTTTNHLLRKGVEGVDGMKTGYTIRAGSCITVTCIRGKRRLIEVLTGFQHRTDRDVCAEKLIEWGYSR